MAPFLLWLEISGCIHVPPKLVVSAPCAEHSHLSQQKSVAGASVVANVLHLRWKVCGSLCITVVLVKREKQGVSRSPPFGVVLLTQKQS